MGRAPRCGRADGQLEGSSLCGRSGWGRWWVSAGCRMAQQLQERGTGGVASGLLILFDDGIGGTADGAEALLSTSARAAATPLTAAPSDSLLLRQSSRMTTPRASCCITTLRVSFCLPPPAPCYRYHVPDADACAAVETEKVYFLLGFVLQVSPPAFALRAGLFALTLCRRRRGCWLTCKGLRTTVLCWPPSAAWHTPKPCTAGLAPSVQGAPVA